MKHFLYLSMLCATLSAAIHTHEPANQKTVQVPIIMYHSLAGDMDSTSISKEAFEVDLRYLQEAGFQSVTITELIDFVRHGTPLPPRPVVLTFDDGYWNNYSAGFLLALKYDMPIVVSVIGKDTEIWSDNGAKDERHGHLTWVQINEMHTSGYVEFGNHTWNLHKTKHGRHGTKIRPNEDLAAYRSVLKDDIGRLQAEFLSRCGTTPATFVYPFGATCPEALLILKEMGFQATLTCREEINTITQNNPDSLFELGRFERTPNHSVQNILEQITTPCPENPASETLVLTGPAHTLLPQ